jgi:hypothetical protein
MFIHIGDFLWEVFTRLSEVENKLAEEQVYIYLYLCIYMYIYIYVNENLYIYK